MKIAYLLQQGVPEIRQKPLSGPAIHVHRVFTEFINIGHQVTLIVQMDGKIWQTIDLVHYKPVQDTWLDRGLFRLFERTVRRIQSELRLPYAALFDGLRFALACNQVVANHDVFYERMGWMGFGGAIASKWLGIPLVLEVNGDHISEMEMLGINPTGMQLKLSSKLTKIATHQAASIIATGDGWRQRFIERWSVEPSKVMVIENGSEAVDLIERNQLACFYDQFDPLAPVKIIYVGGFEPWHGIQVLIRALAKAISQTTRVELTL